MPNPYTSVVSHDSDRPTNEAWINTLDVAGAQRALSQTRLSRRDVSGSVGMCLEENEMISEY